MYVCICNRYRDTEICQLARSGVRCARVAYSSLGNGPRCGRCLDHAQTLIDEIHQDAGRPDGGRPCATARADRPGKPRWSKVHAGSQDQKQEPARRLSPFRKVVADHGDRGSLAAALVVDK